MDLQKFVESFTPMTCIISVEKKPGGKYGAIKIMLPVESDDENIAYCRAQSECPCSVF
ncbi:MAG: hypothetical protein J6127_06705 [Clostridiales bacterium]|nr:hypothetical protein [Clostridiales bacterium]